MGDFETIRVGPFTYTKRPYYRGDGHDWHRKHNGHSNIASAEVSTLVDTIAERDATIKDWEKAVDGFAVNNADLMYEFVKQKRSDRLAALGEEEHKHEFRVICECDPNYCDHPEVCACGVVALGEGE